MVSFLSLGGPATRAENAQILSDAKREGETRCKIRGRICHKDSAFLREMSCDSKRTKAIYNWTALRKETMRGIWLPQPQMPGNQRRSVSAFVRILFASISYRLKSDSLLFFLTEIVVLGTCNWTSNGHKSSFIRLR